MSNVNIHTIHNRILLAYKQIQQLPTSTSLSNHITNIDNYLRLVAPYLINNSYTDYTRLLGYTGVIRSINSIAKHTTNIRQIQQLNNDADCNRCICDSALIEFNYDIICSKCGLQSSSLVPELVDNDSPNTYIKSRRYQQTLLFERCLNNIQGSYVASISQNTINRITDEVIIHNPANIIRWLRTNRLQKHAPYINYIISSVTGYTPPQLTTEERRLIIHLFSEVLISLTDIAMGKRSISYRYYAFKLIEHTLDNSARTNEILSCIHLPKCDTLIRLDKLYEHLCDINQLNYTPTLRRKRAVIDSV